MTTRYTVLSLLALTLLAACVRSVQVKTDYDPKAAFDSFKTYAWIRRPEASRRSSRNDFVDARVKRAVNNELTMRGFREVPSGSGQLGVAYYVVPTTSVGYGYGTGHVQTTVRAYDGGTLILDVVDRGRNELIWRGSGSTRTTGTMSREKAEALVPDVVARILKNFPSRTTN